MCELLKKIYDEVLVYEKDIVNRNKNVDKTVKEWLKPYKKYYLTMIIMSLAK